MTALVFAPSAIRAHLLTAILEARGVETFITGEYAGGRNAWGGIGHVVINVRRGDYDRALSELQGFLAEREESVPGGAPAPMDACPVCGYDLRGLKNHTRCPECGIDRDAITRLRSWIQLAPPPNADPGPVGRAVEAFGVMVGRAMLVLFAAAIIAIIVYIVVH